MPGGGGGVRVRGRGRTGAHGCHTRGLVGLWGIDGWWADGSTVALLSHAQMVPPECQAPRSVTGPQSPQTILTTGTKPPPSLGALLGHLAVVSISFDTQRALR